ncbi:acyltransferase [Segatella copri]|uniref:acyltransferase family protein n=1 Tax=Segatella copri TaxID=165179 RepID=UPI002916FC96|nr:acyltransferase [Segatella copri]MDV3122140.1 acyltransferase [Segatella copri]
MKQRNTDIDWIRAILIILMILIHIVSFGNTYPQLKAGILSFMMPTFLIITGYLVNIEKSPKEMGRYLMCLALPYVIMVTGFSVLSYFMPVRDGITELSLSQICEKIFVTSIGPYWFIQTMIICGILYYVSFKGAIWGTLRQGKTTMSTTTSLFIFATLLLLLSKAPALSPSAATYYFIGAVLRQCHIGFDRIFRPSPVALLLWINLLGLEEWYDWGTLAIVFSCWCCISSLMWIHSLIKRLQDNASVRKTEDTLLYIGRNTLPIYLFHPIFTMAAKFYHPLFSWDRSEICFALVTIFIAIAGSIGIAKIMEKTHLAYLFGKGKMLR